MELETNPALVSQTLQVRLQRPTITAELSFMLAVTKFFVPSFALSGAKPIPFQTFDVQLDSGLLEADQDLWLCPESRLIADSLTIREYTYDGKVCAPVTRPLSCM